MLGIIYIYTSIYITVQERTATATLPLNDESKMGSTGDPRNIVLSDEIEYALPFSGVVPASAACLSSAAKIRPSTPVLPVVVSGVNVLAPWV